MTGIDIHSVVALLEDADDNGKTYAMVALKAQRLIRDCFLVARARVNRLLRWSTRCHRALPPRKSRILTHTRARQTSMISPPSAR